MNFKAPLEIARELEGNAHFTPDQASYIASEVYQPLYTALNTQNYVLKELIASLQIELGTDRATALIQMLSER